MQRVPSLAEYIYLLALREMGRSFPRLPWKRWAYVRSLTEALNIMELLADLLATGREMTWDECTRLQAYLDRGEIMLPPHDQIPAFEAEEPLTGDELKLARSMWVMISMARLYVSRLSTQILRPAVKDKQELRNIVYALPNLPVALFNGGVDTLFGIQRPPVSPTEALAYAAIYTDPRLMFGR